MILRLKPNKWGCQIWSLAMVLDVDPFKLLARLNFDPSEKVGEHYYRGVSDAEIIEMAMLLDVLLVPIFYKMEHPSGLDIPLVIPQNVKFDCMLQAHSQGSLLLRQGHTAAHDGYNVYCPDRGVYKYTSGQWDMALLAFGVDSQNQKLEALRKSQCTF